MARRLIVSFIGNTDIDFITPTPPNFSPILRLLNDLESIRPIISPADTKLVLLNDDKPGVTARASFVETLKSRLPELRLDGLEVSSLKFEVERPTDLEGLYEELRKSLTKIGVRGFKDVIFHITSGTPHMMATLLIYSRNLPRNKVRLYQTSPNQEVSVREVHLPYVLASRDDTRWTTGWAGKRLTEGARRELIDDTVVDDAEVEDAYAALHDLAGGRPRQSRLLLFGPAGSGKWHAVQQFARWRSGPDIAVHEPGKVPADDAIPKDATLRVHRLDRWAETDMIALTVLKDRRPDVFVAATFRTGQYTASRSAVLIDGLPGAVHLELPPLHRRTDVIQLGEAFAIRAGMSAGWLHTRLQQDLLAYRFLRGLHDLETLVTTGALLGDSKHPDRKAYLRVSDALTARDVLDDAWSRFEELRFEKDLTLIDVCSDVQVAALNLGLSRCKGQTELKTHTFVSQQSISRIINSGYKGGWTSSEDPA